MADLRVSSTRPPAGPVAAPSAKAEAVKAAQRAFFDSALAKTTSLAVARAASVDTAVQPVAAIPAPRTPVQPGRLLRPGSLLDVKV